MELIPESTKTAFTAIQKTDKNLKKIKAQTFISSAATASAAAIKSPLPFSDCTAIIPIQIGLLSTISYIFGLKIDKGLLYSLISSVIGCSVASLDGRKIASLLITNLLKCVPGVGLIKSNCNSETSSSLTTAFGELYFETLFSLTENGKIPSNKEIIEKFKILYQQKAKKK